MREEILIVGDAPTLVGVVAKPSTPPPVDRPFLIVLNSGLVPRVGSSRMTVNFTRRMAADGFVAVRFDLSGVGDSDARRDGANAEERWVADTRAVMDHLETAHGATSFVLMGLCSGADTSFQAATVDNRVVGIVLLDGYAYRTVGYYVRYYGARIVHAKAWLRFITRHAARLWIVARNPSADRGAISPVASGSRTASAATAQYVREFPPRYAVAEALREMVTRGLHLCVLNSGGMEIYCNHEGQFRDAFRDVEFGTALTTGYFRNADHTFTETSQQRALHHTIAAWLRGVFPAR